MNYKFFTLCIAAALMLSCGGDSHRQHQPTTATNDCVKCFTLSNEAMSITIGEDGLLYSLRNEQTGHEYSAGGDYMWRLYYDTPDEKEIQVLGDAQDVVVVQEGNTITLRYPRLLARGDTVEMQVTLCVKLEEDKVRFACDIQNNEPHSVVREMQYPLIRNINAPADHKLYTSEAGGRLYDKPIQKINRISSAP